MSQNFDENSLSSLGEDQQTAEMHRILRYRQDSDLNPASAIASASGAAVHGDLLSFNLDCRQSLCLPCVLTLGYFLAPARQQVSVGLLVKQLSWEHVHSHMDLFPS